MPTFMVMTLGCKVNQYETEQLSRQFLQAGFALADHWRSADCAVVNSCSVTATAARKAMNDFFQTRVHLEVWIKVKKSWSSDEAGLSRLGYTD